LSDFIKKLKLSRQIFGETLKYQIS